jgi:hypothetical protein
MVEDLQRIHIEEPLRVILGDLIEAVTITNKVQEGLSTKVRAKISNSKSYNESYGKIAAAPPPSPQGGPGRQKSGPLRYKEKTFWRALRSYCRRQG